MHDRRYGELPAGMAAVTGTVTEFGDFDDEEDEDEEGEEEGEAVRAKPDCLVCVAKEEDPLMFQICELEVVRSPDLKLEPLAAAIEAAKAMGINTAAAEARLAELRPMEAAVALEAALAASNANASAAANAKGGGGRLTVGDTVEIILGHHHGARGRIVQDDEDARPYTILLEGSDEVTDFLSPDMVQRGKPDFKLEQLSAAIEAAKTKGIETAAAEARLAELRSNEVTAPLTAALAAANVAAANAVKGDEADLIVGAKVRVRASVNEPRFGWGEVRPSDVGVVTRLFHQTLRRADDDDDDDDEEEDDEDEDSEARPPNCCTVKFVDLSGNWLEWKAEVAELEIVWHDRKLEPLATAIEAAKASGIDTAAAEERLAELRVEEAAATLEAALGASNAIAAGIATGEAPEPGEFAVGDAVEVVKEGRLLGRSGIVEMVDTSVDFAPDRPIYRLKLDSDSDDGAAEGPPKPADDHAAEELVRAKITRVPDETRREMLDSCTWGELTWLERWSKIVEYAPDLASGQHYSDLPALCANELKPEVFNFRLKELSAAIDAAKEKGIETAAAEARLTELRAAQVTAPLTLALGAANAAASASKATGRPTVGDLVKLIGGSLHGEVVKITNDFRDAYRLWRPRQRVFIDAGEDRVQRVAVHDFKLGELLAAIEAAKAKGIDTAAAEARLAELRPMEAAVALEAALAASNAKASAATVVHDGRLTVGDEVEILSGEHSGSRGVIVKDDEDARPYIVQLEGSGERTDFLNPQQVKRESGGDFKLEQLSAAIGVAKAMGIDTAAAEKRLTELRGEETAAPLSAALAVSDAALNAAEGKTAAPVVVGARVRVIPGIRPEFGWGHDVEPSSIGTVADTGSSRDGLEMVEIDFPGHQGWTGLRREVEVCEMPLVDLKLEALAAAVETANEAGVDTAGAEARLHELESRQATLRTAQDALQQATTLDALDVALGLAAGAKLGEAALITVRERVCDLLIMTIDLATDEPSMKAALELAEQFDQHTGYTGPASSPSRRDLTHAVSRARSGLVEMAAEDARRRERQALGLPDIEYPKEFLCPIGCEPMRDPVAASDGFTYERANIERWLKDHNTSPKVGGPSIPSPRASTHTHVHTVRTRHH